MSKSSTDSGSVSTTIGFRGSTTARGAGGGGRGPVGAGVGPRPLIFGSSIVDAAMSSNLEVAASSLWIIPVSSSRDTGGRKSFISTIAAQWSVADEVVQEKVGESGNSTV